MLKYKLAYRNEDTEWEWIEIGGDHFSVESAKVEAEHRAATMVTSEFGIFGMPQGARCYKDRRPRHIINRQPYDGPLFPAALSQVINTMYVPGKNPR